MKSTAVVLTQVGAPFQIKELELQSPGPSEVLIKVAAAGICHCDYHLFSGASPHKMPVVPGHEGAGWVVETGNNVVDLSVGEFVALNWTPSCGQCEMCIKGHPAFCTGVIAPVLGNDPDHPEPRFSLHGNPVYHYAGISCFSEYTLVHERSCVPINPALPPEIAAMLGCSVATGLGVVINKAQLKAGETALVLGAGGVGLNAVMAAHLLGASQIVVLDQYPHKLGLATALGATQVFEQPSWKMAFDYVFETTGDRELQSAAPEWVKPGGQLHLVGFAPVGSSAAFPTTLVTRREINVIGSYYGGTLPQRDFPVYVDYYLSGELPLDKLLSKTYPIHEINQAYEDLLGGQIVRGAVVFPQ